MTTMTTIKILVIEDMIDTIRGAFELAALSEFNENMIFDFKSRSQDVDFEHIRKYGLIFVDIELARSSRGDGFAIIRRLQNSDLYPLNQTLILTGNTVIEEKLIENNINPNIAIVKKPINYEDIAKELKKRIKLADDGTYTLII